MILGLEEYERLVRREGEPRKLSDFFALSPLAGAEMDLERDPDHGRDVELD